MWLVLPHRKRLKPLGKPKYLGFAPRPERPKEPDVPDQTLRAPGEAYDPSEDDLGFRPSAPKPLPPPSEETEEHL